MDRKTERRLIEFFGKKNTEMSPYPGRLRYRGILITDEGLTYILEHVRGVEQLDLDETQISVKAINALTSLEYVHELRLKDCIHVGDDAIDHLLQISDLRLLHLHGTSVTPQAAKRLTAITTLAILLVSVTDPSDAEGLAGFFQEQRPDLTLVINHQTMY